MLRLLLFKAHLKLFQKSILLSIIIGEFPKLISLALYRFNKISLSALEFDALLQNLISNFSFLKEVTLVYQAINIAFHVRNSLS